MQAVQTTDPLVIEDLNKPAGWYNYLYNDAYYLGYSHLGQGSSNVYQPKPFQTNNEGRFFYILDHDSHDCWNPNYLPLRSTLEDFRTEFALGHAATQSSRHGIQVRTEVSVPVTGKYEIWTISLRNQTRLERDMSLFSAFSIPGNSPMGNGCEVDPETGMLINVSFPRYIRYEEYEQLQPDDHAVFLFADRKPDSYECSFRRFFGAAHTGDIPLAVRNGTCSNLKCEAALPIGALHHHIKLNPESETKLHLVLGCACDLAEARKIQSYLLTENGLENELRKVREYWAQLAGSTTVKTPHSDLNRFANGWLPKQVDYLCRTNRKGANWPIRNSLQDALGYCLIDPDKAKKVVAENIIFQTCDGNIEQWQSRSGKKSDLGLLTHKDAIPWLVFCTAQITRKTGDLGLLDQRLPYKDSSETDSIFEHLVKAVRFAAADVGVHGLCLMGDGDWTDPLNGPGRKGKGESTWISMALKVAADQLTTLAEARGDDAVATEMRQLSQTLDNAVNTHCWDGEWYHYGYDDDGQIFGSHQNAQGQIFLNAQTWAIISGCAKGERLKAVRQSLKRLHTDVGPCLLNPLFREYDPQVGKISAKYPGTSENGSVYCHASMFAAYAYALIGSGDEAVDTVLRTLPDSPDNPNAREGQAPIWLPNFYFGDTESPNFGQSSGWHHTGSAPWMFLVLHEQILGIQADWDGLHVNPCLPADWKTCSCTRTFKGARYDIQIHNPNGQQEGTINITVNGEKLTGTLLPYRPNTHYQVDITLR